MPGKNKVVGTAFRMGVRYGPVAYEAIRHGRAPGRFMMQRTPSRAALRRQALEHAASLIDGSALKVFHADQEVWVVFSADTPVGMHPQVGVPVEQLLEHVDLTQRVVPPRPTQSTGLGRISARRPSRRMITGTDSSAGPQVRTPRGELAAAAQDSAGPRAVVDPTEVTPATVTPAKDGSGDTASKTRAALNSTRQSVARTLRR